MRARAAPRRGLVAVAATAAVAVAALAACGGGGSKAGPTATVPTAPALTTTTNPYAVPAVIDAAYVNRVLEGLDAAIGDVVRLVIRTRDIPPEVFDRLKAIYLNRDDENLFLQGIQDDMRHQFAGYRTNPGNKKSIVEGLLTVSPSCIFVRVVRNYSDVGTNPDPQPSVEWIGLQPREPSLDPNNYNPTPWMIAQEGVRPDGTQPTNRCPNS